MLNMFSQTSFVLVMFLDVKIYFFIYNASQKIYEDKEEKKKHYIDASSPAKSNWLRYVNCARNVREENVYSFGCDGLVFYMTTKDVEPNTELLTWYGENDGHILGITRLHPGCYLIKH